MLYKMIYFSSHKFAFSNLRFSQFYEHFRQLREKCVQIKNKVHHVNQLKEPDLMMYIHMHFSKRNHPTHSTELFKIFFSLLTLSTAFLQKACGPGKNNSDNITKNYNISQINKKKSEFNTNSINNHITKFSEIDQNNENIIKDINNNSNRINNLSDELKNDSDDRYKLIQNNKKILNLLINLIVSI